VTLVPDVLDWVVAAVGAGAQILTIDELPPSSTEKHVVTLGTHHGIVRVVTRRYHDRQRLETDFAYAPANEVRALAIVGSTSVPAPRLYAADLEGTVAGAPLLLEGWVPGAVAWEVGADDTYLTAAAEALVRIHAIPPPAPGVVMSYRPYRDPTESFVLGRGSDRHEVWQNVAEALESPAPDTPGRFIHRDFHPGNALWDGEAIQVVDWGPPRSGRPASIWRGCDRTSPRGTAGRPRTGSYRCMWTPAAIRPSATRTGTSSMPQICGSIATWKLRGTATLGASRTTWPA
jgi:hypothetical protein